MKTLRKTLDEDRTKTFTAEISKLGLVEMTRQNVTEGVREIMSRECPTCDGEGVIRSEETIAIEFERRLRDVVVEHPEAEAFLVQLHPRVSTQFTGHGSRVLHAIEAETGRSFLFEGSEGLALDHFAITFMGTRAEVEDRALPFRQGDEVLVDIVEPHMYAVDDAVAKIDGYIISIAGASPVVGEKRMVRIDQVGRTAASAVLIDEHGEVVRPAAQPEDGKPDGARRRSRGRRGGAAAKAAAAPAAEGAEGAEADDGEREDEGVDAVVEDRSERRRRGHRAPADLEDEETRREAGLSDAPAAIDAEPEQDPAEGRGGRRPASGAGKARSGDASDDEIQSKPRRRGRRGGRRRSAAKAEASE
jgi:ribonuclease G